MLKSGSYEGGISENGRKQSTSKVTLHELLLSTTFLGNYSCMYFCNY